MCSYSLDQKEHVVLSLWSFQGARERIVRPSLTEPHAAVTDGASVSQNSTAYEQLTSRSTFVLGESGHWTSKLIKNRPDAYRSKSSGIPRKEVIQPQLPLRLPCYDFTPIIDPTFDGCLPCGLAHRLRVLPTFVV